MEKSFQLPERHYPFEISDSLPFCYSFSTDNDIQYEVIFKATPNILGDNYLHGHLLYEFSMLAKFGGSHSYVRDELIGSTVIAIFLDFYNKHNRNICFYVSDFRDEKQHVRSRKFHDWYLEYSHGAFTKIDLHFEGYKKMIVSASVIAVNNNPFLAEILPSLINLLTEYNNEK